MTPRRLQREARGHTGGPVRYAEAAPGKPVIGSAMRVQFDRLRSGETVPLEHGFKEQFEEFYGMELERTDQGCRLIGQWEGAYFIPMRDMAANRGEYQ